jgi:drug/metabolite transporter (DMT)-like permease
VLADLWPAQSDPVPAASRAQAQQAFAVVGRPTRPPNDGGHWSCPRMMELESQTGRNDDPGHALPPPPQRRSQQLRGTLIVLVGVLWLTPDSLLIKKVNLSGGWEALLWRHVFYGTTMIVLQLAHAIVTELRLPAQQQQSVVSAATIPSADPAGPCHRNTRHCCCVRSVRLLCERVYITGRVGVLAAAVYVPGATGFVIAQAYTTAANVLLIVATAPIWAALFARVGLGTPVPAHTFVAIAASMAAVVALFWDGVAFSSDEIIGLLFALMCAVGIAAFFVVLRFAATQMPGVSFVFLLPVYSALLCALALCVVGSGASGGFRLPAERMIYPALQGCVVLPISFTALTVG